MIQAGIRRAALAGWRYNCGRSGFFRPEIQTPRHDKDAMMMERDERFVACFRGTWWQRLMFACAGVFCLALGCDTAIIRSALNPAFVDVIGPGIAGQPTGPTSPGHVVVAFRNDTVFDEQLLAFLVQDGLDPTLLDDAELRPRVAVRVRITFPDNETLDVEFVDGSSTIVSAEVDISQFPDLVRNQQDNLVVQCDVVRVELVELPRVFVPSVFETLTVDPGDENSAPFTRLVNRVQPQFEQLERDDVDQNGNTLLQRNLDIRDVPGPAIGPNCGSVVTIVLSGTMRLPFEVNAQNQLVPGVFDFDIEGRATSPGRYQLNVGIR